MKMRVLVCVLALSFALMAPAVVQAHMGTLFGLNMRSLAMANAQAAVADGPVAAFYNPALLADRPGVHIEADYLYTLPSFDLKLKDLDGNSLEEGDLLDDAKNQHGFQFVGFGVSGRILDYVALGIYMHVPVVGLKDNRFVHPATPYWLKYETGMRGMQFHPAVSVQVVPGLMLGLGATVNLDAGGDIDFQAPMANGTFAEMDGDSKWTAGFSVNAGVFYQPFEFLQFGFVYRGENYLKEDETLDLFPFGLDGGVTVPVDATIESDYTPQQFALAVAGRPFEWWMVTLEGVYTFWSQYKEPFPDLEPDYTDLDASGVDYDPAVLILASSDDLDFADTMVIRLGMEFMPIRHFNILAGYGYEPTPVPDQEGTTNILDADTHILALGFGVNFAGEDDQLVRIDVAGQYHAVADRDIEKVVEKMDPFYQDGDNALLNPAYPVTDVSASYFIGGLSVKFLF